MPKVWKSVEERRSYFAAAMRASRMKSAPAAKVDDTNAFVPIILPEDEEVVAALLKNSKPDPPPASVKQIVNVLTSPDSVGTASPAQIVMAAARNVIRNMEYRAPAKLYPLSARFCHSVARATNGHGEEKRITRLYYEINSLPASLGEMRSIAELLNLDKSITENVFFDTRFHGLDDRNYIFKDDWANNYKAYLGSTTGKCHCADTF